MLGDEWERVALYQKNYQPHIRSHSPKKINRIQFIYRNILSNIYYLILAAAPQTSSGSVFKGIRKYPKV